MTLLELIKTMVPIIKVTEIPVKTWIHRYRKWLEFLVQDKSKPIFDFKDNSTTEKPEFLIHWNKNYRCPNYRTLKAESEALELLISH